MKKSAIRMFAAVLAAGFGIGGIGAIAVSAEENWSLTSNFTTAGVSAAANNVYKSVGVQAGDGSSHGALPATAWGTSVVTPEESYLIYKLDAGEGQVFENLSLTFTAKVWNQNDGTCHNYNKINIYYSSDENFSAAAVYSMGAGSNTESTGETVFSNAAQTSVAYVKIELKQYAESPNHDTEGKIGLEYVGVKLFTVNFSGTTAEGVTGEKYSKTSDFTSLTAETAASELYESKNVWYSASADHGIAAGTQAGAYLAAVDEAYIVYALDLKNGKEGYVYDDLTLKFNAKIWNQNSGTAHAGNAIKISYAYKPTNSYKNVQTFTCADTGGANSAKDFTVDLSAVAAGYDIIYVKIDLVQTVEKCDLHTLDGAETSDAKAAIISEHNSTCHGYTADGFIDVWYLGVKVFNVSFTGGIGEGTAKEIYDFERTSDFRTAGVGANGLDSFAGVSTDSNGNQTHGLIPSAQWGNPVLIADESYIVYCLQSEDGYAFSSLSLSFNARIWGQNNDNCYANNAVKVYTGSSAINFGSAVLTAKPADGKSDYTVDLTQYASGKKQLYVKIELVQTIERCALHTVDQISDHIATCGTIATSDGYSDLYALGVKLYTVSFAGNYQVAPETVVVSYNDGDTLLYTDGEQLKDGALSGYTPAEKTGYTFSGWYFDKELTSAVLADYAPSADVTLYAKWTAVDYTVTYELDGGVNAAENPATYTMEDTVTLAAPTKEGFRFVGWYANADFSGAKTESLSGTGNVTLYAKWSEAYDIVYVLDGGTNNASNPPVYYEENGASFADPVKEGYIFAGWYKDEAFSEEVMGIDVGSQGDVTVYARWIPEGGGSSESSSTNSSDTTSDDGASGTTSESNSGNTSSEKSSDDSSGVSGCGSAIGISSVLFAVGTVAAILKKKKND